MSVVSKMKALASLTFSTFSIHPAMPTTFLVFPSPSKSTLFDSNPFLSLRSLSLQTSRLSPLKTSIASIHSQTLVMGACRPPLSGEIRVIVGPMFAGKTTTLIRRIQSESGSGSGSGRFQVRSKMLFYPLDKTLKNLCFSGRLTEAIEHLWLAHVQVDAETYALLLQECIFSKNYMKGKRIHAQIIIVGYNPTEYLMTKLLILYAKLGDLETAQFLFNRLQEKSLISWNAMIAGYVQNGLVDVGLGIYCELREKGFIPDQYTLVSVFKACAALAFLEHGKRAHCVWIKCKFGENVVVNSALVDMYFKCSSLCDGQRVFDESVDRNVISWTSLISGYGLHGKYEEVLVLFDCMKNQGVIPNNVTFLAVLSACSYGGLVKEGNDYFSSMTRDYGIQPSKRHYAAMVHLLGRSGRLKEAFEFVMNAPFRKHPVIWGALLGACRIHGNIDLMNFAAEKFFELEPQNIGKYVVVSNAYASSGLWEIAAEIRGVLNELGLIKEPGYSRIEVDNEVHYFLRGDRSHKRSFEIYKILKEITLMIRNAGYVPEMSHS